MRKYILPVLVIRTSFSSLRRTLFLALLEIRTSFSSLRRTLFLALLVISMLVAMPVFGYLPENGDDTTGDDISTTATTTFAFPNPLGKTSDISTLASKIIDFLILLAIPISMILVVYAGYLYIISAGNEQKIQTAQKALIWALVGFAVVLIARSVPIIIEEFLYG